MRSAPLGPPSATPANFLTRLARRAFSPPAVRPRVASRFETPRVPAADVGMQEEEHERVRSSAEPSSTTIHEPPQRHAQPAAEPDLNEAVNREPEPPVIRQMSALAVTRTTVQLESLAAHDIRALVMRLDAPVAPQNEQTARRAESDDRSQPSTSGIAIDVTSPDRAFASAPETHEKSQEPGVVELHREMLAPLVSAPHEPGPVAANPQAHVPPSSSQPLQVAMNAPLSDAVAPIEIVIGRIEIHTTEVERPAPRVSHTPPAATLSLVDYLRRREGRGQ